MTSKLLGKRWNLDGKDCGVKPYVAILTGVDGEYGFCRQFVGIRHLATGPDAESPHYTLSLPLVEGQVLEFGNWEVLPGDKSRKFFVCVDGKPVSITVETARERLDAVTDRGEEVPF